MSWLEVKAKENLILSQSRMHVVGSVCVLPHFSIEIHNDINTKEKGEVQVVARCFFVTFIYLSYIAMTERHG